MSHATAVRDALERLWPDAATARAGTVARLAAQTTPPPPTPAERTTP